MKVGIAPGVWFRITLACLLLGCAVMVSPALAAEAKADKPAKPAKIDLNTATEEQLQELPGIGEAYAKKIVAGRPYESVKGLSKTGIPAATLKKVTAPGHYEGGCFVSQTGQARQDRLEHGHGRAVAGVAGHRRSLCQEDRGGPSLRECEGIVEDRHSGRHPQEDYAPGHYEGGCFVSQTGQASPRSI